MLYCLNTSTIRPATLPEKIRVASEAGYAAIELWHDEVDGYCQEVHPLAEIRTMLSDAGLHLASMIYLKGWWETEGKERVIVLDECRRRMEQAAELGAAICIAGPPAGSADMESGVLRYRELLELGKSIGVVPALEFLGFVDEFHTLAGAVQVARATGRPDACVVIDPFHLFRGGDGIEVMAELDITAKEIGILHFNDTPEEPARELQHDRHRVMPGDGHLNLQRYVGIASEVGYQGPLSLELFNEELWTHDPLEIARQGLDRMRQIVESA